ncbi:MAG: hypothetical protein QF906_00850 [Dehalococcoidales bacterium]|jgi:hypothetical protein|nr:hypothetical protein [Dehalococcoidales bacterium]MDP7415388.1 hypothetical protein [Dehalococcoidales bacterium]
MNSYSYTGDEPEVDLWLLQTTPKWQRYIIDCPSAFRTRHEANSTVRGGYFQIRDADRAPLAIIHHWIGDELLIPSRLLAQALAKKGVTCSNPFVATSTSGKRVGGGHRLVPRRPHHLLTVVSSDSLENNSLFGVNL